VADTLEPPDPLKFYRSDGVWAIPGTTELSSLQQKQAIVSYIPTGSGAASWARLLQMAEDGFLAIALHNPHSGPGYSTDFEIGGDDWQAWTDVTEPIHDAGALMLSYVSTNYNDSKSASGSHKGAGSVGANYRFLANTNDEITVVSNGTTDVSGGAPGSAMTDLTFETGHGPIGVKSWYSGNSPLVSLPGGLALSTSYWLRRVGSSPTAIYTLHTSLDGALNNHSKVNITSTGGGSGNGPFWFGFRRDEDNVATSICFEMDLLMERYPYLDGWFFDECDVDEPGRDGCFDIIVAHRDTNWPGKHLCMNGTPHSVERMNLYDSFMLENTWAAFESESEDVPSWIQDGTMSPYKCWACINDTSLTPADLADAVTFLRSKNVGLVGLHGTTFSRLPNGTTDGFDQDDADAAVAAGNATPVEAEVSYGALSFTGGAHTPAGSAAYTKLNASSSAGELGSFTHTSNRLTYTGSETKTVHVTFQVGFKKASGTAADIFMRIYRSGSSFNGVKIPLTVAATDVGYQTMGMGWICTLSTGQYLEVYVSSSNTNVLTVSSGSLIVAPV
jgi:hypothetical protein